MSDRRDSFVAWAYRNARKIVIGIVGATVILLGIAMLVLPGPGLVTMLIGLTILAAEFAWARRWLKHARDFAGDAARRVRRRGWTVRGDPPPDG